MGSLKISLDKRRLMTIGIVSLLAFISYVLISLLFSGLLKARNEELENRTLEVSEAKNLFSQKEIFQKEWEAMRSKLKVEPISQDQVLNQWVKDLLSYASEEGITFSKLEPQGMRLYLEFQGDIRKLNRFIYHLLEKDPLSKIDSFSLKKEDSDKNFSYQLTLAKTLL